MTGINPDVFLAVALVINRSRDGPAFVFHYPPHVKSVADAPGRPGSTAAAADLEDVLLERLTQPAAGLDNPGGAASGSGGGTHLSHHRSHDDHLMTESGSQIVPWENVAGFPTRDLAGILTPARSYHKKLFQLSLDPLYCVSCPIHVPENGRWKRPKKASKARSQSQAQSHASKQQLPPQQTDDQGDSDGEPNKAAESTSKDANDPAKKDDNEDEKRSSMTMFNLVFFLNPKKTDTKDLPALLYSNIIKKMNRAYKYSQQYSDFVWKESKRILAAKENGREEQQNMGELWAEILTNSSLAASVRGIYEAVSQNRIAAINLETTAGVLSPSVQIPVPFHVADLPAEDDEDHLGLWLTTAHALFEEEAVEEPGFLDRNFALLLMDDARKIVSELQADRDATTASLIEFVRLAKPTMSFHQLGQTNVLTLSQVRKYAQHFIYWRRAIAIPPLHARDTYILSPNCDLTRLARDAQEWQRAFPIAPPLPAFLADLSTSPRPYKAHCPAKSYRPIYLQMLAWLLRGGWVTQLYTFAYVVVWPEILYEVEYDWEAEELDAAEKTSSQESTSPTLTTAALKPSTSLGDTPLSPTNQSSPPSSASSSPSSSRSALSPTAAPSAMQHTAELARLARIAQKAHREHADKATAHARKAPPHATVRPSINDAAHLAGLEPYIVLDARRASAKESRYLAAIARRLPDGRVRAAWPSLCKYFDGKTALERVALQEDMKRKEAWNLLTAMSEYLICARHW